MPNVTFEKTGNVTGRIAIQITKDELNGKLTEELKKQRQKVSMKGFRKGKTPLSTLRKMMGNQILGNILDEQIKESLFGYIEENDVKLIFSPMPVEEENAPMITATALDDVNLTYDLALEPEFDLKLPKKTFDKLVLNTDDKFLDEQIERMLKQAGENTEVEDGKVEEEDVVDVTFTEAGPVDNPITNSTKLYIDSLSDEGKKKLIGKKVGGKVTLKDLSILEKESTPAYVNKYLLELEDEDADMSGKSFQLVVDKISRITPAEMNEEFFTKFDASGTIKTEEEVRAKIAEDNAAGFNSQGESMANFMIQKELVESHDFELPLAIMEKIQEDEEGDRDMDMFTRGVKWMLIRNKFAAQEDVKLEYEDVKAEALASLMQMLGGQRPDFLTDEFVDNYVGQMLQDEKQREQLSSNAIEKKIMAALRDKVKLKEKPLSADEFNEAIKAFNEENMPAQEEE
ncbi:trigger factor [Neolewinella agarilytica]|uniref:FKBP-type peptidyl-prolyl cis-trans isomerase (Trigger factor) n=1 Tax=Neolewinella agarilytica TaxID=478744 RepID=A0A1H9JC91_9BACT|nr:trigger factor [Neolewinella agarilytica]SEQ84466.1 FKBP-type peptidyl-prolyl cis-trans isomerase (trigger factor) [Neolewinella agarilytica]